MKRIMLLLASVMLAATAVLGQNANRKGFFAELQGGAAIGEVLLISDFNHYYYDTESLPYLKGGFVGSLDLGYRFRISRYFALEAKVGVWSNFADFGNTWIARIMPGIRWTSADFGKNMSVFAAANTGYAIGAYASMAVPLEIGVGINITPNLYAGLVWVFTHDIDRWQLEYLDTSDQNYNHIYSHPYNSLAVRIGYRF